MTASWRSSRSDGSTVSSKTKGWELLMQIDSDVRFGLEMGDVETLCGSDQV